MFYLDSSVVLRLVLSQPDALAAELEHAIAATSELTRLECLRVLDRIRLQGTHSPDELLAMREVLARLLQRCEILQVNPITFRQAGAPLPVPLGTLDALHLASAIQFAATVDEPVTIATHDLQLARAAQAMGFEVFGV